MISVSVQLEDFDPGAEIAALESSGSGGIATFVGLVRGDGGLLHMDLEHYEAMTRAELGAL